MQLATSVMVVFHHGNYKEVVDSIRAATHGETFHTQGVSGLTEAEMISLRDEIYAAFERCGYDTRLPEGMIFEQERDDPSVYHGHMPGAAL